MINKKQSNEQKIKVTQIRSGIGKNPTQNGTLIGLGLGKLHRSVILDNNPSILGMVNAVKHLLKIEQIN